MAVLIILCMTTGHDSRKDELRAHHEDGPRRAGPSLGVAEKRLKRVRGVLRVDPGFIGDTLRVRYDPALLTPDVIRARVELSGARGPGSHR